MKSQTTIQPTEEPGPAELSRSRDVLGALLTIDRDRFSIASKSARALPMAEQEAESFKRTYLELGRLRRRLGGGGGWPDEFDAELRALGAQAQTPPQEDRS
jgi:hypothetical protein